ncbi:helix-turn-helix domain-containing protein [Tengunoibacter tsumagoiensis]|uniref:HTH cro/C1-type domain-containing protein n=1 Tax=Tengunoibacter tsumagoiensis TaxID=2014871 RepID=A0A401ZV82_9CHLR|nr:helix-turn-helix transcriptional regulator [Tengunoibacter tsumagoiensis]GCE10825.1 hypothetical protein KTT_06840 [Tengunoibacter tsumagoiensis]
MHESIPEQHDYLEEGERRYEAFKSTLLSSQEAQAQFEEIVEEQDLWLQLVEARLAAGLTQAELAAKLGVSQAQVARIEKAGYDAYTLKTLRRHVRALGKKLSISIS